MSDFRESSDDYHAIVARLNDRWRVIDSREPYPYRQWILQQRVQKNPVKAWHGKSFLQTREALLRTIREKVSPDIPADVLAPLLHLPDRDMGIPPPKGNTVNADGPGA